MYKGGLDTLKKAGAKRVKFLISSQIFRGLFYSKIYNLHHRLERQVLVEGLLEGRVWCWSHQADSLSCQRARVSLSQVKLGVSALPCHTALAPHWLSRHCRSPIGRTSAPAQDFPAKAQVVAAPAAACQPFQPSAFLRRKRRLVPQRREWLESP